MSNEPIRLVVECGSFGSDPAMAIVGEVRLPQWIKDRCRDGTVELRILPGDDDIKSLQVYPVPEKWPDLEPVEEVEGE